LQAHLLALDYIAALPEAALSAFNLGNDHGYSVKQVLAAVESVVGHRLDITIAQRRPSDATRLVANSGKARSSLGWQPSLSKINEIVQSAWNWHRSPQF
jgi:UDP-glucose 4-epimerase